MRACVVRAGWSGNQGGSHEHQPSNRHFYYLRARGCREPCLGRAIACAGDKGNRLSDPGPRLAVLALSLEGDRIKKPRRLDTRIRPSIRTTARRTQLKNAQDAIARGVAGIAISPTDSSTTPSVLRWRLAPKFRSSLPTSAPIAASMSRSSSLTIIRARLESAKRWPRP